MLLPVLVTALTLCVLPSDTLMAPGISRPLAEYRASRIRNVRYDLSLDVTSRDTARGRVIVAFDRVGKGDVILDFRGPRFWNTEVNGKSVEIASNGAHLRIAARLLRAGPNSVALDFVALIAPAGASIIRYHDLTDGKDYLYTLLVPSDANQLFPCFDQPDLKARTVLSLTVPVGWNAVANGPIERADTAGKSARLSFARTRPMSTYLIAFAAGPWARVTRSIRGRPVTMYVRASRAKEAEADSLIAANARAAEWFAKYFGVAFPWPKLDFLLAPAFPFGGMEHPGAIFYNENSFIYRERPTRPELLGREATIYHEVAHQWFGDLVTMRWFDDLWLKEGFATYMAAKMQAATEPSANTWETFYLRNKPAAYGVDRTEGTTPIWQSLENLDQAKSNYGAIVYNKAPGVLKQLNYLAGDFAFRRGLHAYLSEHAYANATWRDLLRAVGDAGRRPLEKWGAQYILRPGMPVIEQHVVTRGGRLVSVELVQHPARALSGTGAWPIRTEILVTLPGRGADSASVDFATDSTDVRFANPLPAPDFVYANAGDYAYALVIPDSASARWLAANIGALRDPLTRAMGWDALWELVRRGSLPPANFIAIAGRELPGERDEQVLSAQLGHVSRAVRAYLDETERSALAPALETTLLREATNPAKPYGIRKPNLDAFIRVAQTPTGLAILDKLLDSATIAGEPLRAPTRWAIVTRLVAASFPAAEQRLSAERKRDSTSEGKRLAFVAGAAVASADVKRDYFRRYLTDPTLNEDWATASLGAFNELSQQSLTLGYLKPALDTLPWVQRNRRIFFVGRWLDGFLGGQTSPEALAIVRGFLITRRDLSLDLRQKILQTVEELERTVAIRSRIR